MNRSGTSHYVVAAILGVALPAACLGACGDDRGRFVEQEQKFEPDAAIDAPDCRLQCSLDGRNVIEACTGNVVEKCPDNLACGGAKCIEPCAAAAEDKSSNGCDFFFQAPLLTKQLPPSCYAAFIVNTSTQPIDLSLELEGKPIDVSKAMFRTAAGTADLVQHEGSIPVGESVILFLSDASPEMPRNPTWQLSYSACPTGVIPATFAHTLTGGTGIGSSFRLKTNAPVSLTAVYPFGGASSYVPSAMLVFPVASWAKEHILVNGWDEPGGYGGPGAQIVAAEDDTEITIIPKQAIQDGEGIKGVRAGLPVKYKLAKGQHLRLVQDQPLTGSIVASDKPTSIVGAHSCADIPSTAGTCDIVAQQIPAFENWGSEYVGVGYRPRLGNEHEPVPYRIVAARDGTMLDYDPEIPPGAPTTLNAGESALFQNGTGDAFVVRTQDSEHPIYVSAHMTGSAGGGKAKPYGYRGDPEFVNVVATSQYLNAYSFYADPSYGEASLVVVRSKLRGELKDVWLECAGNLTDWKPIGTRGDYEYTRVDLAKGGGAGDKFGSSVCRNGLQRMKSEGPFTATLWGWDFAASYAYPGGMAQRKLVDAPLLGGPH